MNTQNINKLNFDLVDEIAMLTKVEDYLNDVGKARLEAHKAVFYVSSVASSLNGLYNLKEYKDLFSVEDRHPAYYKTLQELDFKIAASLAEGGTK